MNGLSFDRTDAHPAKVTELPEALSALWDACMQNHEGTDVARALTANFVGIAAADGAQRLLDATEVLQRRSPCRAFLLIVDDAADGQTAELSATTRRHGGIRDIVLEQLVLRVPSGDVHRVPGLLRPLIIDDLPSHLLWSLPWPADERRLDALAELCQHAIVDSRTFGNPARELPKLQARRARGARLTDLSWLRLQPWRRALAEAFDRLSWQQGADVRGTIRHGRAARAAALLLDEWLHERLGASIAAEPDGDDGLPGPSHVTLQVGADEVVIDHRDGKLFTHVTTPSHCSLPFTHMASRGTDAELLVLAIDER
ncbi:MAG: glucose-6-phosphate dehydrogenase assembly protein OpcA [Planctomycetes bacterium]|nr:glucose-6-phosphate dehydrogenase assembly protein OpcA [Planctomycetota bacterium]